MNPTDPDNPFIEYIQTFYYNIDPYQYKLVEMFYQTLTISSDFGWLLQDFDYKYDYQFSHYRMDSRIIDRNVDTNLSTIFIFFGRKRVIYERSYIKLQEIAANVGGMLKIMTTIFAFMINYVNKKVMNINIINNIYELTEDIFSSKNEAILKNKTVNSTSPFVISNSQLQKVNESKQVINDLKIISNKTHNSKKLRFNDIQIVLSLIGCSLTNHLKTKNSIYKVCKEEAIEYQNIYKIISKLRELEYLKYLLLNENQLCSFEFISKLKLGESKNHNEFTKTYNRLKNMSTKTKQLTIKNYLMSVKSSSEDIKDIKDSKLLDIVEIIE